MIRSRPHSRIKIAAESSDLFSNGSAKTRAGVAMREERRGAQRYKARVPVEFRCATLTGKGYMFDISLSGARIEEVGQRPLAGDRLRIVFGLGLPTSPDWVPAEVVRHTVTGGFALRFYKIDVRVLGLLRGLIARVEGLSLKPAGN